MRLAFWRAGKDKAGIEQPVVEKPVAEPAAATYKPAAATYKPASATHEPAAAAYRPAVAPESGDLDLRALGQALMRKRGWIIVPTVLAAVISITAVNLVTPRYKSEARILIDGRE